MSVGELGRWHEVGVRAGRSGEEEACQMTQRAWLGNGQQLVAQGGDGVWMD